MQVWNILLLHVTHIKSLVLSILHLARQIQQKQKHVIGLSIKIDQSKLKLRAKPPELFSTIVFFLNF
jgi:hypothetical protein